jgi:hypothetical protein
LEGQWSLPDQVLHNRQPTKAAQQAKTVMRPAIDCPPCNNQIQARSIVTGSVYTAAANTLRNQGERHKEDCAEHGRFRVAEKA